MIEVDLSSIGMRGVRVVPKNYLDLPHKDQSGSIVSLLPDPFISMGLSFSLEGSIGEIKNE